MFSTVRISFNIEQRTGNLFFKPGNFIKQAIANGAACKIFCTLFFYTNAAVDDIIPKRQCCRCYIVIGIFTQHSRKYLNGFAYDLPVIKQAMGLTILG